MTDSARSADVDVAVVGAGAAGIAAARTLLAQGRSVRVLEAGDRVGGRAWTESHSLGVPFDRGCAWFHSADRNPLRELADCHGVHYSPNARSAYHVDGALLDEEATRRLRAAVEGDIAAVREAGLAGVDAPASDYLPATDPHAAVRDYMITAINGVAPARYATAEAAADDDTGQNWVAHEGIGWLIARLADTVPVTRNCRVRTVDASGDPVRIVTDAGDLRARSVIVTVSTGVLAAEGIAFRPALGAHLRDAIAAVPMGFAEKVALRFRAPPFPLAPDTYLVVQRERNGPALGFHLQPGGHPIAVGYAGGPLAAMLAELAAEEATEFALEHLCHAFGAGVRGELVTSTRTRWRDDPLVAGSYSAALPGGGHAARRVLADPVAGRILFAGEATDPVDFATVHGAWRSGERAAVTLSTLLAA